MVVIVENEYVVRPKDPVCFLISFATGEHKSKAETTAKGTKIHDRWKVDYWSTCPTVNDLCSEILEL